MAFPSIMAHAREAAALDTGQMLVKYSKGASKVLLPIAQLEFTIGHLIKGR